MSAVNIIIKENEKFFVAGMKTVLISLFNEEFNKEVCFSDAFTEENVKRADVVVIELSAGENATCIPEFFHRGPGIIIGVLNHYPDYALPLPSCFADMILIERRTSLSRVRNQIRQEWQKKYLMERELNHNCGSCRRKTLSLKQFSIISAICQGQSIQQIANILGVSVKAVRMHKYTVMRKFGLKTECELLAFIRKMNTKKSVVIGSAKFFHP